MSVELAICLPVVLAVLGIALNVLGYLNVCARFDRVAPEAVRTQVASPGYAEEGSALGASRVRTIIEESFIEDNDGRILCDVEVSITPVGAGDTGQSEGASSSSGSGNGADGEGITFTLLSRLERYDCAITYHPWPFDHIVFLDFFTLTHSQSYVVDPFRPGVLF